MATKYWVYSGIIYLDVDVALDAWQDDAEADLPAAEGFVEEREICLHV